MKKKNVLIATWVTLGLTVAVAFNQCGGVKFAEGGQRSDGYSLSARGNNLYQVTQPLTGKGIKPLDIIWVVDNSGSMREEAAAVQANITKFMNSLDLADARVALINDPAAKFSVTLPDTKVPSLMIKQTVGSNSALLFTTIALCSLGADPGTPCGDTWTQNYLKKYPTAAGKLAKFLRPDSRKILVLVTDDNSTMAASKFKGYYDSLYPADSLVAYGWVGLGLKLSPCQTNVPGREMPGTGTVYLDLANMTGGNMNNICDQDWTSKFAELEDNVATLAFDTIPLPQDVIHSEIIAVFMNDRELSLNDYKLNSTGIVLSEAVRAGVPSAKVQVEFKTPKAQ